MIFRPWAPEYCPGSSEDFSAAETVEQGLETSRWQAWSPGQPLPARPLDPGMGEAVGRRTVFRAADCEDWGRVADRVAAGNVGLVGQDSLDSGEADALRNAIASGTFLTSGRHLQHGDSSQASRNMEVYCNCATASTSFFLFYLLLNGSGVGRSYDDALMLVDWAACPDFRLFLDYRHQDSEKVGNCTEVLQSGILGNWWGNCKVLEIPDSREGWAQTLESLESMAFSSTGQPLDVDRLAVLLDFSAIRPEGSPIHGMQGRPASGPISLMRAFAGLWTQVVLPARAGRLARWHQAMLVDHIFSTEVQVGGARRAARMSTKDWHDPGILDFVRIKEAGGLWTSNNSVMVDAEFWRQAGQDDTRAQGIFLESTRCAYVNGEPGFINGDRLEDTAKGLFQGLPEGADFRAGSTKYVVDRGRELLCQTASEAKSLQFPSITNPCGEIPLSVTGGFCVIGDIAPVLAQRQDLAESWDLRVEAAVRLAARFLIRVNLMDSVYAQEVARTNRIGVGLTGLHEWAWARWGLGFRQLLDSSGAGRPFWQALSRLSAACKDEANAYSARLGLARPHTVTTAKPSGSVSKLMGLTEGVHLPARRQYLRWVQFKGTKDLAGQWAEHSDPLLAEYEAAGYPVRHLVTFPGMSIVGFPTEPMVCRLGMGQALVTAPEATPEEQYEWLRLLEQHWLGADQGNNLSFTLKINTGIHSLDSFRQTVLDNQPTVRCCSVLPWNPGATANYEYVPESEISPADFQALKDRIAAHVAGPAEDLDMDSLRCESGVCPI